jgi:hypothetical protein
LTLSFGCSYWSAAIAARIRVCKGS